MSKHWDTEGEKKWNSLDKEGRKVWLRRAGIKSLGMANHEWNKFDLFNIQKLIAMQDDFQIRQVGKRFRIYDSKGKVLRSGGRFPTFNSVEQARLWIDKGFKE